MRALIRLFVIALIAYGVMHYAESPPEWGSRVTSLVAEVTKRSGTTEPPLKALAAQTRAGDIVLYSSDPCPYSREAKAWLRANGFPFTDCNLSTDRHCEAEFLSHGATGTPYLIVRGHHMKDGFDSDEFIAALAR
jgi:glutaredoxin